MNVAGCAYGFSQLFPHLNDSPVQIHQIFHGFYGAFFIPQHKGIVAQGLNFQKVIKGCHLHQLRSGQSPQKGLVKFPSLTGRTNDEPFSVLVQETFGNPGTFCKIVNMGPGYQPVEIDSSYLVFGQNNHMVSRQFFDGVRTELTHFIQLIQIFYASGSEHFYKFYKNFCSSSGIIYGPVMIFQRNI